MGLIDSALLRAVSGNVQATLCRLEPYDAGGAGAIGSWVDLSHR
jgi:hypothetical protein